MLGNKSPERLFGTHPIGTRQRHFNLVRFVIFVFLALASLIVVLPASAQEPTKVVSDDEVNAVAKDLFCPICENTPLDVCETQACEDWRQTIRDKLAGGQSEEQIKDYFADQYGVRALAEPPVEGVTLLLWVVPIIVIPAAVILFGVYLRNIRRSTVGSPEAAAVVSQPTTEPDEPDQDQDPYVARIERELREM